jgi:hypothetical protein
LKDRGVDRRIILKWILGKWNGSMDWNDLVQDRDTRRAVMNAVMNLSFHKMQGISLIPENVLVSYLGFCSM